MKFCAAFNVTRTGLERISVAETSDKYLGASFFKEIIICKGLNKIL